MPSFLTRSLGFSAIPDDIADHSQAQPRTSNLRRTLSADMASEKWISQSGLKKVASVGNLHFHFHDHDDDNEDIWRKEEEEEMEKPKLQSSDIWSSILSQKANNQEQEGSVPYVHPLVKRSASTLSEKSLEICTESLGSETGSDGFSLSASDLDETKGDADADAEAEEETETTVVEEVRVSAPIRCPAPVKKAVGGSPARSFPPPLPSLANRGDGSNVEMRSHRQDGRLVLEAVSVPTHACFRAERQDGRLLLTFSGPGAEPDQEDDVIGDEFDRVGDVIEEYEVPTQDCNTVVSKFMGLSRTWPRRLNKVVNALEDDDDDDDEAEEDYMEVGHAPNPYVYSWRSKVGPAAAAAAHLKGEMGINKLVHVESQYGKSTAVVVEVVVEGKRAGKMGEDDLIPLMFKGCNLQQQLPKKPLLMWDHRCIAT